MSLHRGFIHSHSQKPKTHVPFDQVCKVASTIYALHFF